MRIGLIFSTIVWLCPAALADISVTDALGRELRLAEPATRIVSLAPHITEVVFAAGAGEKLVGVVSYSDFPPPARDIPQVGSYDSVRLESLLALKPDLVLAWRSGNGEEIIRRMEGLGLRVFVSEPRELPDVAETIRQIGVLADSAAVAEKSAATFLEQLAQLQRSYADAAPVSVYYQIWNEPLLTLNGEHLISDVIRLCGGRNVFSDAVTLVTRISIESVIAADPQVIVASGMDEERPEWLDEWRDWESMTAVRNDQLYFVPPDLLQRHTPRIIEGAGMLCAHLESARSAYYEHVGERPASDKAVEESL